MNHRSVKLFVRILSMVLITLAVSAAAFAYPSGSPAGYTGSPGDGQHCVSCHGGSSATVNGWITSNIPAQGYTAGSVYTITVTVSGSGKKGFEVSPQNASGAQLGVLAAGTNNHLTGGTKYVTQNASGSTSSTVSWSFSWTAPAVGTGSVTFYGAFTVGKSSTKLSTMVATENAVIPLTAVASATPSAICSGQSSQLYAVPAGGSGTYTYSWSSVPAGFTSNLQNPVVTPIISTQYIAHVTDGTLSTDASATVSVNQPATASAGNDTTCAYNTAQVPLHGIGANYASVVWTTSGTGTFSDAGTLAGNYFPSVADKTSGSTTLTLTAAAQSPCSAPAVDARVVNFDAPTGISDATDIRSSMTVSPNPSTGRFTLRVSGPDCGNTTVFIADLRGKTVFQQKIGTAGAHPQELDMTGYPKGIYLVKILSGSESLVRKLVLE